MHYQLINEVQLQKKTEHKLGFQIIFKIWSYLFAYHSNLTFF